jgi:hypothetical protein
MRIQQLFFHIVEVGLVKPKFALQGAVRDPALSLEQVEDVLYHLGKTS